jgi:hypothetical protein
MYAFGIDIPLGIILAALIALNLIELVLVLMILSRLRRAEK